MANAVSPVTMPTGTPLAAPVYLVINDGSVVTTSNGIPVNVVAGTISAENPSVGVLGAAIPPDATLLGGSDGTNLQQLLVESASNRNLRIGIYNGANEITTNSTTYTSKFGLDANILGTLGTAFSTAGKVDAKAAAGDIADLAHGSATSANSVPVVIASDQGAVQIKRSTVAVYSLASTAITTTPLNSGDLSVGAYTEIALDINSTAQTGTNPTIQFFYERKAADGIYYVLWQSAVLTAAANTLSTSIGAGMAYNQSLGVTGRLRWVIGGSNTPGYTFSANIQGK